MKKNFIKIIFIYLKICKKMETENFFPNNERKMIINLLEYEWKVKAWFGATRYKLDFG